MHLNSHPTSIIHTHLRVAVVGCGPAGLASALCWQKRGAVVELIDASDDPRVAQIFNPNRSYTIDLTGHGMRALSYIGAEERLKRELIPFHGVRVDVLGTRVDDAFVPAGVTGARGEICRSLLAELVGRDKDQGRLVLRFNSTASIVDAERGLLSIERSDGTMEQAEFDVIVAADGAGSRAQKALGAPIASGQNANHSTIIQLDRNLDKLDEKWLYMLQPPPKTWCVAGAVNKQRVQWFCQIGTVGPLAFSGVQHAHTFLESHCPSLLPYVSDAAVADFARAASVPTGRWKALPRLAQGKVVLIGDACGAFPPIGQGANAALESATVLDQCVGQVPSIAQALQEYSQKWCVELDACRAIALKLDLRKTGWLSTIKSYLYLKLGVLSIQNAKYMSFEAALKREALADRIMVGVLTLVAFVLLVWNWKAK